MEINSIHIYTSDPRRKSIRKLKVMLGKKGYLPTVEKGEAS